MSKKSKKRTKRYQGEDAKTSLKTSNEPIVHRYEAVERNRLQEWWYTNKRVVKVAGYTGGGLLLLSWLLFELIGIIL